MVAPAASVDEEFTRGGGDVEVESLEELCRIQRMTGSWILHQVTHAVRIGLRLDGKWKPDRELVLNIVIVIIIVIIIVVAPFILF